MAQPTRRGAAGPVTGVEVTGPAGPGYDEILTPEALRFLAMLHRRFDPTRRSLLARRRDLQRQLDGSWRPAFLEETADLRRRDWRVRPAPGDLQDRRVEITGPVDRKMVINALNSGANVFMADFEDANAPTWDNLIQGQINLRDAIDRTIDYVSPEGKAYRLNEQVAVLLARPRGWHLPEKHLRVDGEPVSGSLFDFGLYAFHNTHRLLARGSGPYFYLPKLENHLEARLWNDVFLATQDHLGVPVGTIRATVLVETVLASFELDEILHELRDHIVGLNCGRWDYIFSFIKKFRAHPGFVLPDRGTVTMDRHFLRSYTRLVVQTCHRRGAHAMGGMAAQIPIRHDPEANRVALEKVLADKQREVADGHDGTWVAHPGLVELARSVFDAGMTGQHQVHRVFRDLQVGPEDLLTVPEGVITEEGLRHNITVGLLYLESWLNGVGCVPIFNLMEDAATCEISRSQVWQWIRHEAKLADGRVVSPELYRSATAGELERIRGLIGDERFRGGKFDPALKLFDQLVLGPDFEEFLTLPAYEELIKAN